MITMINANDKRGMRQRDSTDGVINCSWEQTVFAEEILLKVNFWLLNRKYSGKWRWWKTGVDKREQ